ncbi:MAG TPA: hypothetical protein VNM48_09065 [Chloroflexota bacterium]|nr:hypothetical protein [Chloroflexota bacterium]
MTTTMTASVRQTPPPRVLIAQRLSGPPLLVALSRSDPDAGYVLDADRDGRYVCPCLGHRWRGDCSHVRAETARHTHTREEAA